MPDQRPEAGACPWASELRTRLLARSPRNICRWLSPDQHRDYQAWIDNDRRLRDLLARLEALGAAAFDADPRWER
jgi:hypothetical protein